MAKRTYCGPAGISYPRFEASQFLFCAFLRASCRVFACLLKPVGFSIARRG